MDKVILTHAEPPHLAYFEQKGKPPINAGAKVRKILTRFLKNVYLGA